MNQEKKGHLFAGIAAVVWSLAFALVRFCRVVVGLDAIPLYLLRFYLVSAAVLAVWFVRRPSWAWLTRRRLAFVTLLALAIGIGFHPMMNTGAGGTATGLMGLLMGTNPLHVTWIAALFLKETMTVRQGIALAMAFAGAIIPLVAGNEMSYTAIIYPLMIAGNAIVAATHTVSLRMMRSWATSWELVSTLIILATLLSVPLTTTHAIDQWRHMPPIGWAAVMYLAWPGLLIPFVLWTKALSILPAATTAVYVFVIMSASAIWGWLLNGDPLMPMHFVGMGLVTVGLYFNAGR